MLVWYVFQGFSHTLPKEMLDAYGQRRMETYSGRYHGYRQIQKQILGSLFFQKARYQTLGGVLFGGLGRNDSKQFLTATMHSEGFQPLPPQKTKMAILKLPFSIGNTSSKGPCSIAMLVFGSVNFHEPSTNNVCAYKTSALQNIIGDWCTPASHGNVFDISWEGVQFF